MSAGSKSSSPQKPLTPWRAKGRHRQQGTNPAHHMSHSRTGEPRMLAGSKSSSPQKPLTNWRANDRHHQQGPKPAHHGNHTHPGEPRTAIVSKVQMQLTMETTHKLESQGQVSSAGLKCSSPQKPLTNWRAKDRCHEQGRNAAHHGSYSLPGEPRTGVVSGVQIQLTTDCSPTGEPRTGVVSRVQIQLTMEATHFLESQRQAS